MEIFEKLQKVNDEEIVLLAQMLNNRFPIEINNSIDLKLVANISSQELSSFLRVILNILAIEDDEIGGYIISSLRKISIQKNNRGFNDCSLTDMLLISSLLVPLIKTNFDINKDKNGKWTFTFSFKNENLVNVLKEVLSCYLDVIKNLKRISFKSPQKEIKIDFYKSEQDKS